MSELLTITDVAIRTGLASSALRYYERRGLIESVGRAGGKRTYEPRVLEQLAMIDLFQQAGFTLDEIAHVASPEGRLSSAWRELAQTKVEELDEQLRLARRAKSIIEHTLQCPHPTLDECPVFQKGVRAHAAARARELSRVTKPAP